MENDAEFGDWMRDFYNRKSKNISDKGYEYARWFSTANKRRQHKFSTMSLLFHLRNVEFNDVLEVGCGPGTWTKLLIEKHPGADFTCLDISEEMLKQFEENVKSARVKTIVNNFLDEDFKKSYDFVFCSRAIEYIPGKKKVVEKFNSLLRPGGKGIIISSPPHPLIFSFKRALGKGVHKEHTQRISVEDLGRFLREAGFKKIEFYPILFSDFPLVPTGFLFRRFYRRKWGVLARMFASGYIVKFEKPLQL
jgi:SAM-dependent methyltransferase